MAFLTSKKTIIGTSLAVAGILSASLALAAYKHKHDHHGHDHLGKNHHGHMHKIHKLDQNDDDMISLSEFTAPAQTMFEALDVNQDGTLSAEEFLSKASDRFARLDADESGVIEEDEMPKRKRYGKDGKGHKHHKSENDAQQS